MKNILPRQVSTKIRFWDVSPRILCDFLIIHCAMLLSFAMSIVYQTHGQPPPTSEDLADAFREYYYYRFLAISPIFSIVFYLNGLYTYVRYYSESEKLKRFVIVVLLSLAVFMTANSLLLPARNLIGRSVALIFVPLALCGLVGIRIAKEWWVHLERDEPLTIRSGNSNPQPILVIGGAGYIGCWLVHRLLEEGHSVRVLDNAVYGLESIRELLNHRHLEFQYGDCRNIQDVVKAMRGISSVVHLAAIVGDPACEIDPKTTIEINYAATRMLVEIAKGNGVERFLFASSCSVYGATDEVMYENSKVEPLSLYGQTKRASEIALIEAARDNFHPVLMRFATVFGLSNRPRFDLVVNLLTAKACQDQVITVYNGQQWRPFVHVKDLAEATILLLKAPLSLVSRQVFNVGDNHLNHTIADVAQVIQRICPHTRLESIENSDLRNYRVSFDKIERLIGFRCQYSVEDGVRQIKLAFDSGEIASYQNILFNNGVFLRESGTPENKNDIDRRVMAAFAGEHISRLVEKGVPIPYSQDHAKAAEAVAAAS